MKFLTWLTVVIIGFESSSCEGEYSGLKCLNYYQIYGIFNIPDKHVIYEPKKLSYDVGDIVTFKCRKNYYLENDQNYIVSCLQKWHGQVEWSNNWPYCKAITCSKPTKFSGHIGVLTGGKLTVGKSITFECYKNTYIWGNGIAHCQPNGQWSDEPPICITIEEFKRKCAEDGKIVDFQGFNRSEPYCRQSVDGMAKKQLKTITVVTATAAVIFSLLILVVAMVAFQRRRLVMRIRRLQEVDVVSEESNNTDHDFNIQLMLPSYSEAVQSKPTGLPPSFEEAMKASSSTSSTSSNQVEEEQQQPGGGACAAPGSTTTVHCTTESNNPSPYDNDFAYENGVYLDDLDPILS